MPIYKVIYIREVEDIDKESAVEKVLYELKNNIVDESAIEIEE